MGAWPRGHGQPAGPPADAQTPNEEGARFRLVYLLAVCRDGDRLLCCRLAPGEPSPGSWTLPGGGIDFGEDPRTAVLRELEEETGLVGRVEGIVGVRSRVYPGRMRDGRSREMHAMALLFRVTVVGGVLRDEPSGSTDRAAWLSRQELATERTVKMLRSALEIAFGERP